MIRLGIVFVLAFDFVMVTSLKCEIGTCGECVRDPDCTWIERKDKGFQCIPNNEFKMKWSKLTLITYRRDRDCVRLQKYLTSVSSYLAPSPMMDEGSQHNPGIGNMIVGKVTTTTTIAPTSTTTLTPTEKMTPSTQTKASPSTPLSTTTTTSMTTTTTPPPSTTAAVPTSTTSGTTTTVTTTSPKTNMATEAPTTTTTATTSTATITEPMTTATTLSTSTTAVTTPVPFTDYPSVSNVHTNVSTQPSVSIDVPSVNHDNEQGSNGDELVSTLNQTNRDWDGPFPLDNPNVDSSVKFPFPVLQNPTKLDLNSTFNCEGYVRNVWEEKVRFAACRLLSLTLSNPERILVTSNLNDWLLQNPMIEETMDCMKLRYQRKMC